MAEDKDKQAAVEAPAAPDMEAIQKRMAELEARAEKAEAEAAEVKAKTVEAEKTKGKAVKPADNPPDPNEYLNQRVIVRLFKDKDKYVDDLDICVNGERILIQRGKDVLIPRKHAMVLRQSMAQDDYARALIDEYQNEYSANKKALS